MVVGIKIPNTDAVVIYRFHAVVRGGKRPATPKCQLKTVGQSKRQFTRKIDSRDTWDLHIDLVYAEK